jgi:predicted acylesterase/phospholipase RssA
MNEEEEILKIEDIQQNTNEEIFQQKTNNIHYDTLVLSGGSTKGLLTLGALQYAYDNFLIHNIKHYIGTSAGAVICFLLSIGYTPIEIIVYICTHQLLEKLQHFNIVAMLNGTGALSFSSIHEQLEKMTIDKIGYLPTLLDLKEKYDKTLICTTYNLTEDKIEYLSYENNPNLPCLIALRMTSNLPLIFENYKYGKNLYIDGGISDNFPIHLADKIGNKVLGITISSESSNFSVKEDNDIIKYIYKLMFIPIAKTIEIKIQNASDKCKIIELENDNVTFFDFNINSVKKLELFSSGYQQMKIFFEK